MSKQEDQLRMWQEWKDTADPEKMSELLSDLTPLLKYNISKYSNYPIPYNVLLHKAMAITRDAMQKYDPDKSQIGTYVSNQLKQMDRFVKQHQNLTYIPEYLAQEFGRYTAAHRTLEEQIDRPPTLGELSKQMKLPAKQIERIQAAMAPQSLMGDSEIAGGDLIEDTGAKHDDIIAYLREELEGNERKAFDYLSGIKGKKLGTQEVADKLNVDVQDVYSWRRRWSRILRNYGL